MSAGIYRIMISGMAVYVRVIGDHPDDWTILPDHFHEPIERRGNGVTEFDIELPHRS